MKKNTYTIPLALVFCLFFLWAISSNLLPTMIRQLMKTCELNTFEASFTETAYWLAYFIFPIPIAMFMKRYSYKAGIIFGLILAAIGGLLFFPAAILKENWAYLCIFFIIATGMCFLETAANPYVTGMLFAGMNLKQIFADKRVYFVSFLRLIAVPLLALVMIKISHLAMFSADGNKIMLIVFLAIITPSASTITQMCQVYGNDSRYASAINVMTTLFSIITMPLMVMLFEAVI